jgi:hypothetical protein
VKLEILSSDVCSVESECVKKRVDKKQVFVWLGDFEVQSKMFSVMKESSHPASRSRLSVKNATGVVKNYF